MLSKFTSFLSNSSGNFAVTFALTLVPLFGAAGAAFDYSQANNVESELQNLVDAAALTGAGYQSSKDSKKKAEALKFFEGNRTMGLVSGTVTPEIDVSGDQVDVTASYLMPTAFLGIIGIPEIEVNVTATATTVTGSPACIIALNESANQAFAFEGNANLNAVNCAVHANSNSGSALHTGGRADVLADGFCAVGGYTGDGFTPVPNTNCSKVADPYEDLPVPGSNACFGEPPLEIKTTGVFLDPGTYCGGIRVWSNAEVTLNPGIYVIKDGPIEIQAQSTVNANAATIYLEGNNSTITVLSGSVFNITAPVTGTYAGFAIAQNRNASVGLTSNIQGGGTLNIVGRVYLPTQTLEVAGGGDVGTSSGYFAMIADKFLVHGNGQVKAEVNSSYGMPPTTMNTITAVRLVK